MPRTAQRQDRISLRLSPDSKRKVERAAAYADKTVTDFVLDCALQKAEEIVHRHGSITLSAEEWARFERLLLDPPKPNARLKRAFAEHARIVRR